ncbi:MAG: gamma-glutamyltransferase, partial [Actinomycetota bacterium]
SYYLSVTWDPVWAKYSEARDLFGPDGDPLREGDLLVQAELAEALQLVADKGPDTFYGGELGREIVETIHRDGGFMEIDDLARYEATMRRPITTEAWGWRISANPPPAVGGAVLVHMLALLHDADLSDPVERLSAIVEAQRTAMGFRRERYQDPSGIASAFEEAVEALAGAGRSLEEDAVPYIESNRRSSATTHSSAADADGYVCSVTESNGYGAGLVVRGMLLNNTLGEEELNPLGVHYLKPGSRCHSNMAPTIAEGPGITVGLGSPGADRIVGAIAQTLIRLAVDGASLEESVSAPRAHLDPRPEGETLCFEPGLPGETLCFEPGVPGESGEFLARPYDEIHMYFGAVQAASVTDEGLVAAIHDPRRSGGHILV